MFKVVALITALGTDIEGTLQSIIFKMKILSTVFLICCVENSLSNVCEESENSSIVITTQARGRLGNHLWLLMQLLAFKLKNSHVNYFLTEESKSILSKYFQGFEDEKIVEDLCGFPQFYQHFVNYTDQKIIDYYEAKTG